MPRTRVSSGTEWEDAVGYSRAGRTGAEIHVSGTTATDADGNVVGVGDPAAQTRQALANVRDALEDLDASLGDVVRTRLFVTDIEQWEAIGRAHGEADRREASEWRAGESGSRRAAPSSARLARRRRWSRSKS